VPADTNRHKRIWRGCNRALVRPPSPTGASAMSTFQSRWSAPIGVAADDGLRPTRRRADRWRRGGRFSSSARRTGIRQLALLRCSDRGPRFRIRVGAATRSEPATWVQLVRSGQHAGVTRIGVIQQRVVARAGRRRSWLPVLLHSGASITSADSASPPTREPMSRRRWRWLSGRPRAADLGARIRPHRVANTNAQRTQDAAFAPVSPTRGAAPT
jgi:hypothetical protein